ncbi:MAG: hypothetical protein JNJ76_09465 [Candidatus Competibacter sp.]|nr:hypothetical protein [Candidatus Competibacter sp.]
MSDADSATREIPEYPPLCGPEDWAKFLRLSKSLLERVTIRQGPPSDDEFRIWSTRSRPATSGDCTNQNDKAPPEKSRWGFFHCGLRHHGFGQIFRSVR